MKDRIDLLVEEVKRLLDLGDRDLAELWLAEGLDELRRSRLPASGSKAEPDCG